jgi:mitochondrial intermembrane space import and assembly protein 40
MTDSRPDAVHAPPETSRETETYPTIDALAEQRRSQPSPSLTAPASQSQSLAAPDVASAPAGPEALEEEAGQQGAFNEETGEINWDCPCLGGMAHGPCGEQFRAAFSCFVFSKEEPKGVDCIEHFKTMQNCFRDHPDVYGSELEEEEVEAGIAAEQEGSSVGDAVPVPANASVGSTEGGMEKVKVIGGEQPSSPDAVDAKRERAQAATKQVQQDHGEPSPEASTAVPKAAHDAR